jgi:hypothetical protein
VIPATSVDLIDPETGELQVIGWSINGEKYVRDNSAEDGNPLGWKPLNILRKRGVNFFVMQTPRHYISFVIPVDFGFLCLSKIEIFEIAEGPLRTHGEQLAELPLICPEGSPLADDIKLEHPYFDFKFAPGSSGTHHLTLSVSTI